MDGGVAHVLAETCRKRGGIALAEHIHLLGDGERRDVEGQSLAAAVIGQDGLLLQVERTLLDAVGNAEELAAQRGGAVLLHFLGDGIHQYAAHVSGGGFEIALALNGVQAGVIVGQLVCNRRVEQLVGVRGRLEPAEYFKRQCCHMGLFSWGLRGRAVR